MKKSVLTTVIAAACGCILLLGSCCKSKGELVIVAHVTTTSQYKDEVVKAFEKVVKGTRTEKGNVSYILYEHADDPLKFTFVEEWKDQTAIQEHSASAHFQEFAKTIEGKANLEIYTLKEKF